MQVEHLVDMTVEALIAVKVERMESGTVELAQEDLIQNRMSLLS